MNNETKSVNAICHSVEFGLRVIGVWPGTSYAILCRVCCIFSMVVFQIFQYRYLIMHFSESNIFLLMDVMSATLTYSLLLIKLIIIVFNVRLLNDTIAHMEEDWKKLDISDEYTMKKMAYISCRFSNLIIGSHAISIFFYATGTLMKSKSSNQTDIRELLLKMELPFKIESTLVYLTVLVTQFVHQISAASIVAVVNCLLLTLVLHVCGQIDIMRQKLSEITQKNTEQDINKNIAKMLIVQHQKIISFSKNIETLFSNIALVQFVSNTFVLCSLGFVIVISIGVPGGSPMLLKSVFFYILVSLEAFVFCFLGEYLSTKSKMVGDAAYEALWYELNPIQNRDILFIIVRSQKYLTLTVGKISNLSLCQFTNIMKVSASYMSVLHAMY